MLSLLQKFFGGNEKEVRKLEPLIAEINVLEETTKKLKEKKDLI